MQKEKAKIDWLTTLVSAFTIFSISLTSIGYLANTMLEPIKKDTIKNKEEIVKNKERIENAKSLMMEGQKEMLNLINLNSKETLSLLNEMNVRIVEFSSDSKYTKENLKDIKEQLKEQLKGNKNVE